MDGMNAGLGSIAPGVGTPGGTPRVPEGQMGASRQSMEQLVEAARKMSDGQLADILSGRSMEVPQFVAMSEAMGRKQLRTAMQGAQSQQAQQPSLREQLLAETAAQAAPAPQATLPEEMGIGALPAPNMEQIDSMAGGGIVAFADEGLVQSSPSWFDRMGERLGISMGQKPYDPKVPNELSRWWEGGASERYRRAATLPGLSALPPMDSDIEGEIVEPELAEMRKQQGPTSSSVESKEPSAPRQAPSATATVAEAVTQEPRNPFAQFATSDEDLENTLSKQRDQSQGEFLMQIGASLLTSPTIAEGLGKGTQAALPFLISNKREANKLRQDARDFKFNVAKAQEAVEMGDQEMAYKYEKLAADKAYQAGVLATKGTTGGITSKDLFTAFNNQKKEILKNPVTAAQYSKMTDAQKAQFDQQILQEIQRSYATIAGGGAMMPQGGLAPDLQAAIEAEYQRRTSGE